MGFFPTSSAWDCIPRQCLYGPRVPNSRHKPAADRPAPAPEPARLQAPLARLLRPLVRLLVRGGVTFPALTELLRELYVLSLIHI